MIDHLHESLQSQWRLLQERWENSIDLWNDVVRRHFETAIWADFEERMSAGLEGLEFLCAAIADARREVA